MSNICLNAASPSTQPLTAVLDLYQALVGVLARPSSIEAMLQQALETVADHLGASGAAAIIWRPGAAASGISVACGALAKDDVRGWSATAVHPADLSMSLDVLQGLAVEWGELAACAHNLALFGATAWLSHRGEYGMACIVGLRSVGTAPWRQQALAAAAGLVGHAMERMRLSAEMEARLAERDVRWSSLYDIGVRLARETDSERLLEVIVRSAIALLHARGGVLTQVDEVTGENVITASYLDGEPAAFMLGQRSPRGKGLAGRVVVTGEPAIDPDHHVHHGPNHPPFHTSVMAAPLFVQGACVGVLAVGDRAPLRRFTREELQTLVLLAQQAGVLLERARSRAHDELLTLHRERARLARELHDGLAQNLASLLLKADLCHELAQSSAPELAHEVNLLADGLQRAIRETRSAIFSLHDAASDGEHLRDALRLLAARFEEQAGCAVELTWNGARGRPLSPSRHMALLGVAQEALNNSRKHACPTRVRIHLNETCRNSVELSVQDDGCGFDPERLVEAAVTGHYGVLGMRSRIEHLGGSLQIETSIGCGTTVTASLPLASAEGVDRGTNHFPDRG